ncbi:MAG: hypothetical protein H0V43_01160 [Gemmatimonadales bacterium]|nr:hypothetical protein [Gemmatimonadales bacterium]
MKLVDTEETIVLVTGASQDVENRDRRVAEVLKEEIDRRGAGHAYRRAVVVTDAWYLDNRLFHLNPTIALGGPGANGVAQEFAAALPTLYNREEQVFVQADFEGDPKRAAVWGANAAFTAAAVEVFTTHGFLDDLLGRIWRFRVGMMI